MKHKLSHWFPAHVKPVRVGAYQITINKWYCWWDGKSWGWAARTPSRSYIYRSIDNAPQYKSWRGIVK